MNVRDFFLSVVTGAISGRLTISSAISSSFGKTKFAVDEFNIALDESVARMLIEHNLFFPRARTSGMRKV